MTAPWYPQTQRSSGSLLDETLGSRFRRAPQTDNPSNRPVEQPLNGTQNTAPYVNMTPPAPAAPTAQPARPPAAAPASPTPPGATPLQGATPYVNPFRSANLSTPTPAQNDAGQTAPAPRGTPTPPPLNGVTVAPVPSQQPVADTRSAEEQWRDYQRRYQEWANQFGGHPGDHNWGLGPNNVETDVSRSMPLPPSVPAPSGFNMAGDEVPNTAPATPAPTEGSTWRGDPRYSMTGDANLDALINEGLINPSRFNRELVQNMWEGRAGDIDTQYDLANQDLVSNLAARGIRDSTFGGAKQQALAGERRTAKSRALQSLAEDIANTMSEDRSRAISDALSLRGQRIGESQFDRNFGLAERFGIDDRNFRNRQFDWQREYDTERFNADRQDAQDRIYQYLVSMGLI